MNTHDKADIDRISRVMRAARKISGKGQIEVAKALEVSQSALSKFESRILIPSASQWFRFCKLFEVDSLEAFTFGTIDHGYRTSLKGCYPGSSFKVPKKYSHSPGSKVRTMRPFLHHFEAQIGEEKLEHYLKEQKVHPDFLVVQDNQMNIGFSLDLVTTMIGAGVLGKKDLSALTRPLADASMHGALRHKYDALQSGMQLIQSLIENVQQYEVNCDYKIESSEVKTIDLSISPAEHLERFDYKSSILGDFLCRFKKSYFQRFSTYQGGRPVEIEESECHFKGAGRCLYHIRGVA